VATPHVYEHHLPAATAAAFPSWAALVGGWNDTQPHYTRQTLSTAGRQPLWGFAKGRAFPGLLTDAIVGRELGLTFAWETWRRGRDALPSNCSLSSGHASLNVASLRFPSSVGGDGPSWPWTHDHSKWGVSLEGMRDPSEHRASTLQGKQAGSQKGALLLHPARELVGDEHPAPPGRSQSLLTMPGVGVLELSASPQRTPAHKRLQREDSKRVVCFGDMNRSHYQTQRGGVYVCVSHPALWVAFHELLQQVDACRLSVIAASQTAA